MYKNKTKKSIYGQKIRIGESELKQYKTREKENGKDKRKEVKRKSIEDNQYLRRE